MKVVFTGGGTGGHIFPIISLIREIKRRKPEIEIKIYYLGPKDSFSFKLLKKENVIIKKIWAGKIRRYFSFKNIIDIFKVPFGIIQAIFWLFVIAPDLVFSKGGYGSFPAVLASKILAVPVFLHESDTAPGLASKIEAKWATEIFTSFPDTEKIPKDKKIWVGHPLRKEVMDGSAKKAKEELNISSDRQIVFFIGGSQGSQTLNENVLEALPKMIKKFEVIHQTGKKNFKQTKAEAESVIFEEENEKFYHPIPFLNGKQLGNVMKAADIVVSRAGSGSIFLLTAHRKPSILVPLSHAAQDHQVKNAYQLANKEACEVIEERNLHPHFLLARIEHFLSRIDLLKEMSNRAEEFSRPKAREIISSYILEYLKALKSSKKQ